MTPDRLAAFTNFLHANYWLSPADVEPTSTKGYWQLKALCSGTPTCRAPIHGFLFNEDPMRHTVHYLDPRRERGRFASPYRTWRAARAEYLAAQAANTNRGA